METLEMLKTASEIETLAIVWWICFKDGETSKENDPCSGQLLMFKNIQVVDMSKLINSF